MGAAHTAEDVRLDAIWGHIAAIAQADGAAPLNKHPGLYEIVADSWTLKINGHKETIEGVLPYHAAVEFNGWPAGMIHAYGGVIAAGDLANLETLEAALCAREKSEAR